MLIMLTIPMRKIFSAVLAILFSIAMVQPSLAQYDDPATHDREGLTDSTYTVSDSNYRPDPLPRISGKNVENVILFIPDGTSYPQITAAQQYAVGPDGLLNLQNLPVNGTVKTHSSDDLITDSAAGATTYATGRKTRNGMIAMTADTLRLKTLLELAEERGMSTGLVATSSITHATPASFGSHVESRYMEPEIASQLIESGAEVLLGGGKHFFVPQDVQGSKRKDDRNLLDAARENGYQFVEERDALLSADADRLLGLFQMGALKTQPPEPSLAEMTEKALQKLSANNKGFFLMVEGSQVDWGGHDNNIAYVIDELLEFDQAVKVGTDFSAQSGNTLVVVVSDHETGGLTLTQSSDDNSQVKVSFSTTHHTGLPVPVYAYGPSAEEFDGTFNNTEIGRMLARLLKFKDFPLEVSVSK